MMPTYGRNQIASSQASAVCGRRFFGTKMRASTRAVMSTASAAIVIAAASQPGSMSSVWQW